MPSRSGSTPEASPGVGEVLELSVQDVARGGAGVARAETGQVVFIPLTAPGDRVRAQVLKRNRRVIHAELVELLEAGPHRVEPRCPAFGQCGGCQWQHLDYELQWQVKLRGVHEALRRVAVVLDPPPDEFPATHVWEYRNRIQVRGRGRELGFFAAASRELVPVDRCDLADPALNARWEEVRSKGERVGGAYKVELDVDEAGRVRFAWDSPHGAAGFRQVHEAQNQRMRAWVDAALGEGDELLDLYGGRGNLSELPGVRFQTVHCVDPGAPHAGDERRRFHQARTTPWVATHARKAPPGLRRAAILDPPRQGLGRDGDRIAKALADLGACEVVLVSCDPDAFARDIGAFLRRGYELDRAAVLDFFPQTKHVESVARLRL